MSHHDDKNTNKLPLPPRWLRCPRRGQLIANKFIPFKTPLDSKYDDQISEVYRFPPSMFLDCMHSQKIKVGFWIDLTNTSRFYDRSEVEKAGVRYVKLQCKGHGECPSKDQTELFINLCDNFIKNHPLEVIGLHCTHGFNRTGFLICAFLVERFSWSVDAAVQVFSSSRSPGIYKSDYIAELFTRYGDSTYAVPPPPPLPDWCMDEDDSLDDDGNPVQVNGKDDSNHSFDEEPRRRREFFKKNATFMEGITGIEPITKQPLLAQIQRQCQDMCGWDSSGFPGSQPVSMDKDNIKLLSQKPYKVSWKADGTRYMMLIDGEDEVYMIDRDNVVFKVPYLKFPKRKDLDSNITKTLLDGEMIIDKVHGQSIPRYLIYDIIKFEGQDVGGTDFGRRLYCIRKEIIDPRHILMQQGKIERAKEPFSVRNKNFWDTPVVPNLLAEKFSKTVSHEIDGLIFQPKKNPYMCGRSPEVLKWKPPSLNSVDFKLVIQKISGQLGMLPETRGNLFVGGLKTPFSCIKVTKDLKQYDGKIIECTYDGNVWKFLRERTDKSFPNSYDTAIGVCNSIRVPITKELLLEHINRKRIPQDRDLMPPPAKIPKVSSSQ